LPHKVAYATIGGGLAREDARLMVTVPLVTVPLVTVTTSAGEVGAGEVGAADLGEKVFPASIGWWTDAETDKVLPHWNHAYVQAGEVPGPRERGVPEEDVEQMLVRNPREFFGQGAGT
jgi:hypothetical protein